MINNVTSQHSMQNQVQNMPVLKSQQPQSAPQMPTEVQPQTDTVQLVTTQPKQSPVPPLYKYIEGNQKLNLIAATLGGIFWGLNDAKDDLQRTIVRYAATDKQMLEGKVENPEKFIQESRLKPLAKEVINDPTRLKYKDLLTTTELSRTICRVGGKTLMIAGSLYACDYLCQKFFKNNKEYEEYYQDSLKNQKE